MNRRDMHYFQVWPIKYSHMCISMFFSFAWLKWEQGWKLWKPGFELGKSSAGPWITP